MKLKNRKKVVEEIDITFPYFTSNSAHCFMFTENGTCFQVSAYFKQMQVHQKHSFPMSWMLHEEISKEEFITEFEVAKAEFIRLMNETHD